LSFAIHILGKMLVIIFHLRAAKAAIVE
jgi:hypothetical protein